MEHAHQTCSLISRESVGFTTDAKSRRRIMLADTVPRIHRPQCGRPASTKECDHPDRIDYRQRHAIDGKCRYPARRRFHVNE
jgi:hypothetical protein